MARAIHGALAAFRRAPLVQAVAIGTVAVSLVLVGLVRLVAVNLDRMAESWGRGVQVLVYLEDGVTPVRVRKIADAVARLPGVTGVRTVEGAEAWERLKRSLGDRGVLLDGVEESLLPVSLEVSLRDGLPTAQRLQPEFERLKKTAGVEEVELMGDWVDRLVRAVRLLRLGGLFLAGLVGIASLYVVSSTIRLGVFARRDEIEILKLVGATDGFVKGPFLIEGMIQGSVGAAAALLMLYGLFRFAAPHVQSTLGAALCSMPLTFLAPVECAWALCIGAAVGLVGSNLAVNQHVDRV